MLLAESESAAQSRAWSSRTSSRWESAQDVRLRVLVWGVWFQVFKPLRPGILNGVKEGVSPSDKNFVTKTMMSCGIFTAGGSDVLYNY